MLNFLLKSILMVKTRSLVVQSLSFAVNSYLFLGLFFPNAMVQPVPTLDILQKHFANNDHVLNYTSSWLRLAHLIIISNPKLVLIKICMVHWKSQTERPNGQVVGSFVDQQKSTDQFNYSNPPQR